MKTAEEIYSECLDQYIKGNSEINKICSTQRQLSVYAMKLYANQKLDEASEKVTTKTEKRLVKNHVLNPLNPTGIRMVFTVVDKKSILNIKDNV